MTNGYNIHIVGRHLESTEGLKQHIFDKLAKLDRLTDQILDVIVRLEVEKKIHHNVSISLKYAHTKIQAHASTTDLYASIDKAIDRLVHKLSKWKSKIQEHHSKQPKVEEVDVTVWGGFDLEEINEEIEEENERQLNERYSLPTIAKKKKIPLKSLTMEEAVMKMELSNDAFLVYRGEEDQRIRVIYRRRDRSYGVITPE